jgi:hypothetical protein
MKSLRDGTFSIEHLLQTVYKQVLMESKKETENAGFVE